MAQKQKLDGHAAPPLTQTRGTTRDKAKDEMLLSFPSTKGQEPTDTLMCVGTGANRTWESLLAHGRGLAQTTPGQRQSTFKDDPCLVCPSSPLIEANRRY